MSLLWIIILCWLGFFGAMVLPLDDCVLREKWEPRLIVSNEKFDEIYRPINQTEEEPLVYLVSIKIVRNSNFVSIIRAEYDESGACQDQNRVTWHSGNMSVESKAKSGCSYAFQWESVLVYFNHNFTLGVLTECSLKKKIHHVIFSYNGNGKLPSKGEVQDLVMHYEGDEINLEETKEGFLTFMSSSDAFPHCSCQNHSAPLNKQDMNPSQVYSHIILVIFLFFIVVFEYYV